MASITASRNFQVIRGATTNVLGDVVVAGFTDVNDGGVVNVGGSFIHSNRNENFGVLGSSDGRASALNITNAAGSTIDSLDFVHTSASTLDVGSINASRNFLVSSGATTNVLGDVTVAGSTETNVGSMLNVGGNFVHSNDEAVLEIRGNSSFAVAGNADIDAARFAVSDSNAQFAGTVTTGELAIIGNGSTIAPGTSVGTITFDVTSAATLAHDLVFESGSNYLWELDDAGADLISVNGDLLLADGTMLTLADDGRMMSIDISDQFDVFNYSGSLTASGLGDELTGIMLDTSLVDGLAHWDTTGVGIFDDGGGQVYLSGLRVTAVPEPGSVLVLCGAASFFGLVESRKRRRKAIALDAESDNLDSEPSVV